MNILGQYSQYNGSPAPTQDKTAPVQATVGEPAVDDADPPVAPEINTDIPPGIIAEPGKDVFAKDDRDAKKSVARYDPDQKDVPSSSPGVDGDGDGERVISVVGVETTISSGVEGAEGRTEGTLEPLEAGVGEMSLLEDQTTVPPVRQPEAPLDHEEALADQVAHELYPEARGVPEEEPASDDSE